jgi:hypothetical protein
MKRNASVLCKKQAIYYLFITFDRKRLEVGLIPLQHIFLDDSQNCQNLGATAVDL